MVHGPNFMVHVVLSAAAAKVQFEPAAGSILAAWSAALHRSVLTNIMVPDIPNTEVYRFRYLK